MAQKKTKKNKNIALLTIGCIVIGLLIILLIFICNKNKIYSNLKETGFFNEVFGKTPEFVENHDVDKSSKKNDILQEKEEVIINLSENKSKNQTENSQKNEDSKKSQENQTEKKESQKKLITEKEETNIEIKKELKAESNINLCFVLIDGDGSVVRKMVQRKIPKSDSPLTSAIKSLLQGPSLTLSNEKDCMTLIPEGTVLLSAKIQDKVAYLNFNESFEFNPFGVEGYIHQLEQIVFTATSFSTVTSVQFLIDGEKREYLGSEGQWIGSPLSRNSF